jgi:sugar transferase (PEP-CTERM system associated)
MMFVAIFQLCFYYCDLYDLHALHRREEQFICLGQSLGAGSLLLGMMYFIFPHLLIGRGVFFISTTLMFVFVGLSRIALDAAWRIAAPRQNVLILGTEDLAVTLARELSRRDDLSFRVVGFIDSGARPRAGTGTSRQEEPQLLCGYPVLGAAEDVNAVVAEQKVSRIVVAMEDRRGALPVRDLVRLRVEGVRVEDAPSVIASLTGRVWINTVKPSWFLFSDGFHRSRWIAIVKRALDLAFGIAGLLLMAPAMAALAIAIRLESRGPILYLQVRVGLRGRTFQLWKFRSMRIDAEHMTGAQWARQEDPRVTRVGRFIRKYRLDEMPQFLNIIRGEMSFIGPRPERPEFVKKLRQEISYYDERHSVRPGLTGWAQVQYQYGASVEDAWRKLEYDLFYLQNMSIFFDLVILLKTVRIVLTGQGGR